MNWAFSTDENVNSCDEYFDKDCCVLKFIYFQGQIQGFALYWQKKYSGPMMEIKNILLKYGFIWC